MMKVVKGSSKKFLLTNYFDTIKVGSFDRGAIDEKNLARFKWHYYVLNPQSKSCVKSRNTSWGGMNIE